MSNLLERFEEKMSEMFYYQELSKDYAIDIGDSVTVAPSGTEGAFALEKPDTVSILPKNSKEVVKRMLLLKEDAELLLEDSKTFYQFFNAIADFMEEKGCYSITYRGPSGNYCRLVEGDSNVIEIRAYGYCDE